MTNEKLRQLVMQAVWLDRDIAEKSALLKQLKDQLAAEAETRLDEAVRTEGGGQSVVLDGQDGCVCRVTTAGRTLKATLKPDDKKFAKIKEAARGFFARLFETEVVHRPVEDFRDQARTLLGVEAAPLIKLMENPGKVTVSFETKEPATATI